MKDSKHYIVVVSGKADQKRYELTKGSIHAGSDPACDIRLPGPDIAPLHFLLQLSGDRYILVRKDRSVQVNGREVGQAVLNHNDTIKVGGFVLSYQQPDLAEQSKTLRDGAGGATEQDAAANPRKRSNLTMILLAVYLVAMSLLLAYAGVFMGGDGDNDMLQKRLQELDKACQNSHLVNKDEIRDMVMEAFLAETRVPWQEMHRRLKTALNSTVPTAADAYDEKILAEDPLRLFLLDEARRVVPMAK